ncbi:hypothetical protein JCM9534A_76740 [Catenuloplanes indicus JCM 9534]
MPLPAWCYRLLPILLPIPAKALSTYTWPGGPRGVGGRPGVGALTARAAARLARPGGCVRCGGAGAAVGR